jgi:hypothetical protein
MFGGCFGGLFLHIFAKIGRCLGLLLCLFVMKSKMIMVGVVNKLIPKLTGFWRVLKRPIFGLF